MNQRTRFVAGFGLAVALISAPVFAQPRPFDLNPQLTQPEFQQLTEELGSLLRFRQLGDVAPLGKGRYDIGVHYASTPIDDPNGKWDTSSMAFPRMLARFGVSDRVDLGAWGGYNSGANYGFAGFDTRIALMTQGPGRAVSVAIRPSVTSLVGPDDVWVGNASFDISLSRTFGAWSPYAGLGASSSIGLERSKDVDLDYATAQTSLSYAGLSYQWRALVVSAEAEKGKRTSYALRVSSRF